jgi:hypothetical protein
LNQNYLPSQTQPIAKTQQAEFRRIPVSGLNQNQPQQETQQKKQAKRRKQIEHSGNQQRRGLLDQEQ